MLTLFSIRVLLFQPIALVCKFPLLVCHLYDTAPTASQFNWTTVKVFVRIIEMFSGWIMTTGRCPRNYAFDSDNNTCTKCLLVT